MENSLKTSIAVCEYGDDDVSTSICYNEGRNTVIICNGTADGGATGVVFGSLFGVTLLALITVTTIFVLWVMRNSKTRKGHYNTPPTE